MAPLFLFNFAGKPIILKLKISSFYVAILYFILTLVLLTVPGTALPAQDDNSDKIVHLGMFFGLCYLFCRPFKTSSLSVAEKRSWFFSIALYGCAYGIIMEFVQKYFIPFRSYDAWDVVFDGIGCLLGFLWSSRFF
jgi:VanZ family protein